MNRSRTNRVMTHLDMISSRSSHFFHSQVVRGTARTPVSKVNNRVSACPPLSMWIESPRWILAVSAWYVAQNMHAIPKVLSHTSP